MNENKLREPVTHKLKTLPEYWFEICVGRKKFELRKNDRDFRVGDSVILQEWTLDGGYTGDELYRQINYILRGPLYGLEEGYCIFGLF